MANVFDYDPKVLPPEIEAAMPLPLEGAVFPPRANPLPGPTDARTCALEALQAYLSAIPIQRLGGMDAVGKREEPSTYSIPLKNMLIGWPDFEERLTFPSIVMLSGGKTNNDYPLTPYTIEETYDQFCKGTVLQVLYEYNEPIILEIWATKKPELRGIMRAIEAACMPEEGAGSVYMTTKHYFERTARFMFKESQLQENANSAIGRRVGQIFLDMSINVVRLVNANTMIPVTQVIVDVNVETDQVVTDADVDGIND